MVSEWRLWMGAGILAVGVGAALAVGSGTAQADSTGTGSSGGTHQQKKSTAGPARAHAKPASSAKAGGRSAASRANIVSTNPITEQDKAIAEQGKAIAEQQKDFAGDLKHVVTTTNFSVLPPEVNATRVYTGTGSAALISAADGWNGLANNLNGAAQSVNGVVKAFDSAPGPVGNALASAAQPYVGWLSAAAAQAQNAATQAAAAGAAFETAFVGNVPTSAIDANRAQLAALAASNFFSGNIPAIVATEALYAGMWAQDVAAMAGYKP
jgi:PPE-repeat protein